MTYNGKVTVEFQPPLRLGLSGKMRSGKDTLADYLVACHGFQKFSFAQRLKELAVELFGARAGKKDRALLVSLGAHLCAIDPMVFVNSAMMKMPLNADVVVSDVRFPYEFHALKMMGFRLVRIHVGRAEQERRVLASEPGTDLALLDDPSETALDEFVGWDEVVDGELPRRTINRLVSDDLAVWRRS